MKYNNIKRGVFLDRPNRFVADIELDGKRVQCHVKNTGRCRELLVPGAEIWVQETASPNRKTPCDLITVRKGDRLINIDSAAPNKVFGEWLEAGGMGFLPALIRPEYTHGDSRFDFYFEAEEKRALAEIKGVTLEEDGVVRFPDAPTERGVKHLYGLKSALEEDFETYAVFIVQMRCARWLEPNRATHPAFGEALCCAQRAGVHILALDCDVTENSISVHGPVEVRV